MNLKSFTYPEKEKLKSRKLIKKIFEQGEAIKFYPILIRFVLQNTDTHSVGVSVSKRNFKKAVDRIRIKRQLREAYRLNKEKLQNTDSKYAMMIIFIGKKEMTSKDIQETVKSLFKELQ
jgi:ribonuclease P protein component